MESRAYGVLRGKTARIKSSNVDPVWLAGELLAADIIGEEEEKDARNTNVPKPERRVELVELVMGNGEGGVFQTFVNILLRKRHLKWLGKEIKGVSYNANAPRYTSGQYHV